MIAYDTIPVRQRTPELRYLCRHALNVKGCFGGLGGSKVAQLSTFFTRGVGFFGTIGFTGIMDRFVRRLALAGVLQHEQAADCS